MLTGTDERAKTIDRFRRKFKCARQRPGNLWTYIGDKKLVVFKRKDGRYGWLTERDGYDPVFCPMSWATRREALEALAVSVGFIQSY